VYSEHGEDDWLLAHFPPDFKGYAVEVGALDGKYLSNTLLLEEHGWRCLCIEPNPRWTESLMKNRKWVSTIACGSANGFRELRESTAPGFTQTTLRETAWPVVATASVNRLDDHLSGLSVPALDVLSVDVDGLEYEIIEAANLAKWRPKVIVVEALTDPSEVGGYIQRFGYAREARMSYNDIWVRT
jgi:FkbM family methyltransferase